MTRAYVGLGANLGDRVAALARAARELDSLGGVRVVAMSHAYESEPWGVSDQPAFANAVAALDTDLDAPGLLAALKDVERRMGRTAGRRYGPRVIDLDLLLFGDIRLGSPDLAVPHPRLLERDFVVTPLLEVAPHVRLPGGERVSRDAAVHGRVTADLGAVPGFGGPEAG